MAGSNVNPEVHATINDNGKYTVHTIVHNPGVHPLPPSAGIVTTVSKGAGSQTISVHGTVAGVVIDNQLTK